MADLVEVVTDMVEPKTLARARTTLGGRDEGDKFSSWMVRFFEMAR